LARKNIELHESSRMKSQFLANISHELRTPLNSIIGYTELICNGTYGALNDTQRDRLQKVIRNGYNLLSLVNDVLDLNRIETGRATLERRTVTTGPLLDSVLDTIAPLATRKGLIITRDFSDVPPVFADEIRLRQIVTNIVSNAVKFTQQGGVTVRAFGANDMVRFEFADTGIGIAPDQHEKVFEEFQQLENTVTREYEGTGLGMAITKKLVELHGGRIWLESLPGQGTTFFVTLPVAQDRISHHGALMHVEQQ
jgi:signal transduction histidine kinase